MNWLKVTKKCKNKHYENKKQLYNILRGSAKNVIVKKIDERIEIFFFI